MGLISGNGKGGVVTQRMGSDARLTLDVDVTGFVIMVKRRPTRLPRGGHMATVALNLDNPMDTPAGQRRRLTGYVFSAVYPGVAPLLRVGKHVRIVGLFMLSERKRDDYRYIHVTEMVRCADD